jgi:hypothetical protein
MWSCHVRDDLLGTDEAACCHSPVVLRYGPVPGKPRTNNTPCAWNVAELLSLRVHAGGPEPPPLGANSAVATTSTSPSPALAHPRPLARPCPLAPVPPCRPVALFPSFPPYPRFFCCSLTDPVAHKQRMHTIMSTRQRTSGSHLGYTPAQGPAMGLVPGATRAPQIEAT